MPNDFIKEILSNTYTVSDLRYRLGLLRGALEKRFFSGAEDSSLSSLLRNSAHEDKEEDVRAVIKWGGIIEHMTSDNIYKELDGISQRVDKLSKFVLYVPCSISEDKTKEIANWLRGEINEYLLVDLKIDPWVAGGCGFIWNDKYYDYSFKYFAERHKEELKNMIGERGSKKKEKEITKFRS